MHYAFFEQPDEFPEVVAFVDAVAARLGIRLRRYRLGFREGVRALLAETGTRAILLGTRRGDPNAAGQSELMPSDNGWPDFVRVNPVLDWAYADVWAYLRADAARVYCPLYAQVRDRKRDRQKV